MKLHGDFEVSVPTYDEAIAWPVAVNLQSAVAELTIWLTPADIAAILSGIPSDYAVRALKAGTAAGASAFWKLSDDGLLFIVVGHDDESWDVGVTLSSPCREILQSGLATFHEAITRSNKSLERTRER